MVEPQTSKRSMVQQEVITEHGWSRKHPALPLLLSIYRMGALTMRYTQAETNEQTTLFAQEPTTQRKRSISIYRVSLVRESRLHCYHKQIRSSTDASTLLHTYLADVDREHFVVLMLDQKNKIIGIHTVSSGSLSASVVHPREVFNPAILSNAANILIAHNPPSGAPRSAYIESFRWKTL